MLQVGRLDERVGEHRVVTVFIVILLPRVPPLLFRLLIQHIVRRCYILLVGALADLGVSLLPVFLTVLGLLLLLGLWLLHGLS
jgi:hypothetical protein